MNELIVHCKKSPFDVYIGRPSIWGNPFTIGIDGDRKEVIRKHKEWLQTGNSFGNVLATERKRQAVLARIKELRLKTLGCWCNEGEECHGDYLVELANKEN